MLALARTAAVPEVLRKRFVGAEREARWVGSRPLTGTVNCRIGCSRRPRGWSSTPACSRCCARKGLFLSTSVSTSPASARRCAPRSSTDCWRNAGNGASNPRHPPTRRRCGSTSIGQKPNSGTNGTARSRRYSPSTSSRRPSRAGRKTIWPGSRAREFLAELGDLIEKRPPKHLKEALDESPELSRRFDFRKLAFKLILSFREDYLAHIEELKRHIPSLTYNRSRLQPMNGRQAQEVVLKSGGHLVDEDVAARIIGIAAGRGTAEHPPDPSEYGDLEIDPALLSMICRELNGRRQPGRAAPDHARSDLGSRATDPR